MKISFFNKEKLSVSDINKIYKAFYDKYINQYFKNESYEMNGKLIYQRYCSIEEKQKEAYETDYSCLWRSFIFKDLELFQENSEKAVLEIRNMKIWFKLYICFIFRWD